MHRAALLVSGFSSVLLATALVAAATVRVGGELEVTAIAVAGLAVASVFGAHLAARVFSERLRRAALLAAALLALAAPRIVEEASAIATTHDTAARDLAALFPFFLVATLLLGPVLLVAIVATAALARDLAARAERADPVAWIAAGAALALGSAPFLLFSSPGSTGSLVLAGAGFACALALRIAAGTGSPCAVPASGALTRPAEWLLAAAGGVLFGRAAAWIDARTFDAPATTYLTGAAVALGIGLASLGSRVVFRSPLDPLRVLAAAPFFVGFAAAGRILPRPPDSTGAAVAALLGSVIVACSIQAPVRRRRALAIATAVVGIAAATLGASRDPFDGGECEPDGSHVARRALEDDRSVVWHAGTPLETLEVDPYAAARAVGLLLCHVAGPERMLVLGAGGAPFARALEVATDGRVTWVTPLAREAALERDPDPSRIEIVAARERAWLERDRGGWDVVIVASPTRGPARFARLLTREFGDLVLARLGAGGIAGQVFHAGSLEAGQLVQHLLPTTGFPEYRCFVDHPGNPVPLLLRVAGPGSRGDVPARFESRFAPVARRLPALREADLDSFGLLQCYLFDDSILSPRFEESWHNEDACPRLSTRFDPRPGTDPSTRSRTLAALAEHRASIGELYRDLTPDRPGYSARYGAIQFRLRRDHEAAESILRGAIARAAAGEILLVPGAVPKLAELPILLGATAVSPDLALIRRPLERALSSAFDRRDHGTAWRILEVLARVQPERLDVQLKLAELEARRGRPKRAEGIYRAILEKQPNHHAATINLAFLLAGFGDATRRLEAGAILAAAIAAADSREQALDPISRRIAGALHHSLTGDHASARAEAALLPESVRAIASVRLLDLPRRGDR